MASPQEDETKIDYVVEVGPSGSPRLRVKIGDREIPLGLSPDQAGQVGRALLAVSALCNSDSLPPNDTAIENCHFPVIRWGTGWSNGSGLPVLLVEVPGGTQLTLQFDHETAQQCGAGLVRAGSEPQKII